MSATERTGAQDAARGLQALGVSKRFGGIPAAKDVTIEVVPGRIVGLIGPNGAGKSTVLNCISGIDRPTEGTILLDGIDVTGWPVHRRARAGVGRTFQLLRLFESLTVAENIAVGIDSTPITRLAGGPRSGRADHLRLAVRERSQKALQHVGLEHLYASDVDRLTAGQRRLVEIARLLALDVGVLLLDEPAAGLNPAEADELFSIIAELGAKGKAILLVEHRIRSVLQVANELVVMDHGEVIAQGDAHEVMKDEVVQEAYMGRSDAVS